MLVIFPIVAMIIIITMIVCVVYMASRYKRCPPDKILVIFGAVGNGRRAICVRTGAFVLPLYQDYSYLSLTPMEKEIDLPHCISSDNEYGVAIKAKATFAIGTEEQLMYNAAERLLNLSIKDIEDLAKEIIEGQTRLTIASFPPRSLTKDSIELIEAIKASIDPELNKLGLKIINLNISDLKQFKVS